MKGFLLPNYTQVPNILIDEIMRDMDGAELKVVLVAIRKTIGYHKISDAISLSQFEELTGLSRQGVLNGLEQAINRGVMRELDERGPRGVKLYTPVWIKEAEKVDQSTNLTSQESDQSNELTSTSQTSLPTKESVKERKAEESQHPTMQEADAAIFSQKEHATAAAVVDESLSKVITAYERNIGAITPMIADNLKAALEEHSAETIIDAITEAINNNVRKWKYCAVILDRWKREGRGDNRKTATPAPLPRYRTMSEPDEPPTLSVMSEEDRQHALSLIAARKARMAQESADATEKAS